jgi:hypothetical protein
VAEQEPGASGLLATGITAVSDSDVWAFGCTGFGPGTGTWHFNGRSWTQVNGIAAKVVAASALSATNIGGIGSTSEEGCGSTLVHYNGTSWQRVTGLPQSGLEFGTIPALSSTNVWATAGNTSGGAAQLVHFNGSTWTSIKVPYSGVMLDAFAPDGQGGFWMDSHSVQSKTLVLHYSASGQWSRQTAASGSMLSFALVPGTTTVLGAGWVPTATAGNARTWEYGQAG